MPTILLTINQYCLRAPLYISLLDKDQTRNEEQKYELSSMDSNLKIKPGERGHFYESFNRLLFDVWSHIQNGGSSSRGSKRSKKRRS
jgi:hypothetical protein